jgi:hypothetical protein
MKRTLTAVVLIAALGGCGGDDPAPSEELHHVHGLGVDARSGDLFIATHNGLFVAPAGKASVRRVGESRQDIMGFSVAGPRRFVGSGHPAPGARLPPNLGLIESVDGGRTWRTVSLLGQADFHVLRSAGRTVYGVDSGTGRLMASRDGGRSWDTRDTPAGVLDLAIDPRDAGRVVASTERGMFGSLDGGRRWRPLQGDVGGLLAWPAPRSLYLVDARGQVARSTDGGRRFAAVGDAGGQPVAFAGVPGGLYVALADATVKSSGDGGATWAVRAVPS